MAADPINYPGIRWNRKAVCLAAGIGGLLIAGLAGGGGSAEESKDSGVAGLRPFDAAGEVPELALLMGDLQRLTHKMALSAEAGNAELASFYMYESIEQLKVIQQDVPEYEGQPVALLVDRMGLPAYEQFKAAVEAKPASREQMLSALDGVVQSCNQCHAATQHGIIRITRGTDVNPFNQSFKP